MEEVECRGSFRRVVRRRETREVRGRDGRGIAEGRENRKGRGCLQTVSATAGWEKGPHSLSRGGGGDGEFESGQCCRGNRPAGGNGRRCDVRRLRLLRRRRRRGPPCRSGIGCLGETAPLPPPPAKKRALVTRVLGLRRIEIGEKKDEAAADFPDGFGGGGRRVRERILYFDTVENDSVGRREVTASEETTVTEKEIVTEGEAPRPIGC